MTTTDTPSTPWERPAPPAPKRTNWTVVAIVVGVVVALAIIGTIGNALDHNDNKTRTSSLRSPSTSSRAPSSNSMSWYAPMMSALNSWTEDIGTSQQNSAEGDTASLYVNCLTDLRSDLSALRDATGDVPYPTVQAPMFEAIDNYDIAVDACLDDDYTTMATYMRAGNAAMNRATAAVTAVTP